MAAAPRFGWRRWLPWLVLAVLPLLVHLPALSGWFRFDPLYVVSGVTPGTWTTNGLLPGYPWVDGNAGVTTEALGGLAARDWLSLHLPWWNPYSGVGLPLAGEGQTPAFFLPFALLLAVPHGLLALRMVLMALAGFFTCALLRRLRIGPGAALAGAMLFELNGTFAWFAHGPIMPVAFLPLILLGLEDARTRFPLAGVLGVAWSFTAGFPETAFLNLLFAALWGAVRLGQARDRWRYAVRACGAVVAGLLLAAPALWPFLQDLPREFVGSHAGVVRSGFEAADLPLLLFPGIFGAPLAARVTLGRADPVWYLLGGYCDVLLLTLALLGVRWRGPQRAMRCAMLGWVVVTAARAAGLPFALFLFGLVPFLRQANVQLYIFPSWSMGLAILAALALEDWRAGAAMHRRAVIAVMGALLLVAGVAAAPTVCDLWANLAGYRALLPVAVGVPLLAAAVTLRLVGGAWRAGRGAALVVLAAGNAAWLFMVPELAGTHGRQVDAGAIGYLQAHAGLQRVLSLGPLVPNYGALYGVAEIGHNYLPVPDPWVAYVRAHLMPGSDGVNFYEGAPPPKLAALLPAYRAVGVGLVAVAAGAQPFQAGVPGAPSVAYRGTTMDIWRVPDAAPFFEAAGCGVAPASRDDVTVTCAAPSRLRRLALFWDGCRARVGGRDVPIAAEGIFQTVAVPAGVSRVMFRYAPPGIGIAWVGAFCGLVLTLGGLVLRGRPRALPLDPTGA